MKNVIKLFVAGFLLVGSTQAMQVLEVTPENKEASNKDVSKKTVQQKDDYCAEGNKLADLLLKTAAKLDENIVQQTIDTISHPALKFACTLLSCDVSRLAQGKKKTESEKLEMAIEIIEKRLGLYDDSESDESDSENSDRD